MTTFINLLTQNPKDVFFSVFGAVLGTALSLIVSKEKNNPLFNNQTSITTMTIFIKQKVLESRDPDNYHKNNSKKESVSNSSGVSLELIFGGLFIGASLYAHYLSFLLNFLFGITVFVLTSLIVLVIRLYRSNQLDKLNRWWSILGLIICALSFFNMYFISKQHIVLSGFEGLSKAIYFLIGYVGIIAMNALLVLIIIHLFALNSFLRKPGFISTYILKLVPFPMYRLRDVVVFSSIVIGLSLISVWLSSGNANDFITHLNQSNTNAFLNSIPKTH